MQEQMQLAILKGEEMAQQMETQDPEKAQRIRYQVQEIEVSQGLYMGHTRPLDSIQTTNYQLPACWYQGSSSSLVILWVALPNLT